jgi:hypothetical protein
MSRVIAATAALLFLIAPLWAQTTNHTVTITWTNPTTRTDASALPASAIAKVDVMDSMVSGLPLGTITGGTTTTWTSLQLAVGTHVLSLVWTDTAGNKSAASNTMSVVVPAPLAPPSAGTLDSAILN